MEIARMTCVSEPTHNDYFRLSKGRWRDWILDRPWLVEWFPAMSEMMMIDIVLHNRPSADRIRIDSNAIPFDLDGRKEWLFVDLEAWIVEHAPASGIVHLEIQHGD